MAGNGKSQRQVGSVADADPGCDGDRLGLPFVLTQLQGGIGIEQIEAIVLGTGDGKRSAKASGAAGELACCGFDCAFGCWIVHGDTSIDGHCFDAQHRFEGADEDAAGFAFWLAGHIDAVVHSVDEVHVCVTGRPEHDLVSGRDSAKAVRRGIGSLGDVGAQVGLYFDDAPGEPAGWGARSKQLAEKLGRDDLRRFGEEPPLHPLPVSRQGLRIQGLPACRLSDWPFGANHGVWKLTSSQVRTKMAKMSGEFFQTLCWMIDRCE